ncbi:MAG: alpha/beta fold hydrolase [Anaerolineae bacterium]|nr:alpha/beta fold hydrolase [Anaerolineae bacterium]
MADQFPTLLPGGEPFFFPGNKIGCLLVHGFTATPHEVRGLGEHLAQRGCTVLGIRLAGHATRPADMARTRWQDWLASVEAGWHLLQDHTDKVFLCGMSTGGALSLLFASQFDVAAVVSMSAPHNIPGERRIRRTRPFKDLLAKIKPYRQKNPSHWHDPAAEKARVAYTVNPTRAIYELDDLLGEMRAALPKISAPVLLIHSRDDKYILPENMPRIYAALGSPDKHMLWVENSQHVITLDAARRQVYQAAADFIHQHHG